MMEKTTKKIIIAKLQISELERYRQFEIRLPSHVKKITGVIITASLI